jgi:hypothetical protein
MALMLWLISHNQRNDDDDAMLSEPSNCPSPQGPEGLAHQQHKHTS